MATTLGAIVDELLGIKPPNKKPRQPDTRLMRRMQQIDKLLAKDKRQVLQILDALIAQRKAG